MTRRSFLALAHVTRRSFLACAHVTRRSFLACAHVTRRSFLACAHVTCRSFLAWPAGRVAGALPWLAVLGLMGRLFNEMGKKWGFCKNNRYLCKMIGMVADVNMDYNTIMI